MIELFTDIIERSKVLLAPGRVEIFIAERDHGFSWGALAKPRPGAWRGTHVTILTNEALKCLEEEHDGYAQRGYLYTSRMEPERTTFLNVEDGVDQRGKVRVRARITSAGIPERVEIIRPLRSQPR